MKLIYTKTFLKDLTKVVPPKRRHQIEEFVFESLPKFSSIESVGKNNSSVELKRILNRKEIYKFFP